MSVFRHKLSSTTFAIALAAALPTPAAAKSLSIEVLSTKPAVVTGGDVRMRVLAGSKPVPASVALNGMPSAEIMLDEDGSFVVTGLKLGQNDVRASAPGFGDATIRIVNHPRSGPIFSGPHLSPWICAGAEPSASSPTPTPESLNATCDRPSSYSLYYRTTQANCSPKLSVPDACFRPYTPGVRPPDLAQTVTDQGARLDYIVRVERGALNRGLYDLAVLYRPAAAGKSLSSGPLGGWNRKMLWVFGGSSGVFRKQLPPASTWVNDDALRRGFMVGVSNFTDGSLNNNRVLAAETLMMRASTSPTLMGRSAT